MTPGAVYQLARAAGLGHDAAVTATAIAKAESGLRTDARGDTGITTGTWGPSIGLWQVRSLKTETGTGRSRDANRLTDPAFNARSMVSISGGGSNWGPWSVYKSGAYRTHVAAVEAAVGAAGGIAAPSINRGTVQPAGWDDIGGWAGGLAGDLIGPGVTGGAELLNAFPSWDEIMNGLMTGVVVAAAVGLGVTLVAIGTWRVVSQ